MPTDPTPAAVSSPPLDTTTTNYWLVASYATLIALWAASQVVYIPYVVHLMVLVTSILYAACHASLGTPDGTEPPKDGSSAAPSDREVLRAEDAYQFPLMGSVSLFGLFLAFRYLDKDLVNLVIGGYFAVVGCFAVTMTMDPLVRRILFFSAKNKEMSWTHVLKHPLPAWLAGESPWDITLKFTMSQVVSIILAATICTFYMQSRPWYLNNVLGMCFCLQGIEQLSLGTFKIGAILLIGLFFYDIFWVFGTEVMVSVARNLDGPIKILFPRDSLEINPVTGKLDLSLLGLGDIVIPGFFLALLLRFDAHQARQSGHAPMGMHASFPKPYFHSCLVGYVLGLATTLLVMIQFNAAQPALLYLVPACLGSSMGCAVWRGEVKSLLAYSEEEAEEEEEGAESAEKLSQDKKDE